jgi:hypothetical protein
VDVDGRPIAGLDAYRRFARIGSYYVWTFDGRKLALGSHTLHVTLSGDPTLFSVPFRVVKPGTRDDHDDEHHHHDDDND